MNEVIHTVDLTKHYGKVQAVEKISLSVGKGEIYGFIGLNGAGKTTTIRMLLGMIRPTSGASYLNGEKIDGGNYRIWNQVGYIVEIPYSYPELTVRENLGIVCKLRGVSTNKNVDHIISQLQLDSYADVRAEHLSLGNAQRLGLAKALLHRPSILILDEPANGLDPAGIVEIRELLQNLAHNHGVTIFISSHILGEMAKITSRIGIIHEGHLIQEVDTNQLELLLRKRLLLNARDKTAAITALSQAGYKVGLNQEGIMEILDRKGHKSSRGDSPPFSSGRLPSNPTDSCGGRPGELFFKDHRRDRRICPMRSIVAAFSCEALKVFRSRILWITIVAFLMLPLAGGFFMFILKDPELARSSGLISAKAHLAGTADWPSYLQFLAQGVSAGGLFVFGFVSSWVFGREYSDRTVKDLLALPIPRTSDSDS